MVDAQRSERCPALRGGGSTPLTCTRAGGGIGIRVRLRCVSRKGWRFESSPAHRVQACPESIEGFESCPRHKAKRFGYCEVLLKRKISIVSETIQQNLRRFCKPSRPHK